MMVDWAALRVMAWDSAKAAGVAAVLLALAYVFNIVGNIAPPAERKHILWPVLENTFYGLVISVAAAFCLVMALAVVLLAIDGLRRWYMSAKCRARGATDA